MNNNINHDTGDGPLAHALADVAEMMGVDRVHVQNAIQDAAAQWIEGALPEDQIVVLNFLELVLGDYPFVLLSTPGLIDTVRSTVAMPND